MLFSPQLLVGRPPKLITAAATTTWNPSDKSANAVLSNGNLTLTSNDAGNWRGARSVAALTSNQKCYYEILIDAQAFSNIIGFGNASAVLNGSPGGTSDGGAIAGNGAYFNSGGADNGGTGISGGFTAADVVNVALDSQNSTIWFRKNDTGNWNNNALAVPSLNVGGFAFTIGAGSIYAIAAAGDTADQMTARFSSASWTGTAPSGFTQLAA